MMKSWLEAGSMAIGVVGVLSGILNESCSENEYSDEDINNMKDGKAPKDDQGKSIELHHEDQDPEGGLTEMTREKHRGKGYDKVNHPHKGKMPSKIDRNKFRKERENYWKKKAEQHKKKKG